MLEKYCDILVIGTELPGLVTAAFLARRGLSVQILQSDFFEDHPNLPDPACLTSVHSKMLRSILGRLNVPETSIQNFLHRSSNLQVIFPRHRIDVFANPLDYADEIDREFPGHRDQIRSFYENLARLRHQTDVNELFQQLLPSTWRERRAFRKFVENHRLNDRSTAYAEFIRADPVLKAYFQAQFLLGYQTSCDEPFAFQIAELFNPSDGEIFNVMAGLKPLTTLLLERIAHYDGRVRRKTSPQKLLYRNGIMEGVEIDGSQDTVLAKYVVWNAPLGRLRGLLPKKCRFRKLRKLCRDAEPGLLWFTARYKLPARLVPEPMKRNAVIITDPHKTFQGANLLYLQISDPDAEDIRCIDVNFLMPRDFIKRELADFGEVFSGIEAALAELMPFSEKALTRVFPIEQTRPESQDTLFPLHASDIDVFRHVAESHGVNEQNETKFAELFPLHFRTRAPNFFITHPDVFRALGLESKLTLGLKITDIVWHEVEKEKKRAMKAERRIA